MLKVNHKTLVSLHNIFTNKVFKSSGFGKLLREYQNFNQRESRLLQTEAAQAMVE
jgi:hypothetical protein